MRRIRGWLRALSWNPFHAARVQRIAASGLFDENFYNEQNPDVVAASMLPLIHYIAFGGAEGRDPNPLFSTAFYLARNPEARQPNRTPLEHYLDHCLEFDPNPLFRTAFYLERHPDLVLGDRAPLAHFIAEGAPLDWDPHPMFSMRWYLERYPDIAAIGMNALQHFLWAGAAEHRDPHPLFRTSHFLARVGHDSVHQTVPALSFLANPSGPEASSHPLFDPDWYRKENPGIDRDYTALEHFLWTGGSAGRDPCPMFDAAGYLERQPRVAASRANPLVHYVEHGWRQGCDPHPLFWGKWYLATNPDVVSLDIDPASHYLREGVLRGLEPHPLFDRTWYSENQMDEDERHLDPFIHFLGVARSATVDPGPLFDVEAYLDRHPRLERNSIAALVDFDENRVHSELLEDAQPGVDSTGDYERWIREFDTLKGEGHAAIAAAVAEGSRPLVSILLPVHDPEIDALNEAVDSVLGQIYSNWELCVVDDGSKKQEIVSFVKALPARDSRVRVRRLAESGHICRASNEALTIASGELIALLDHDDLLRPHSIALAVLELRKHPGARMVYSDEDYLDVEGKRCAPFFKPDWNRELLHSYNYVCHFSVFERSLIREVDGFREGTEGAQDWDLFLRMSELVEDHQIRHIPRILYHWRCGANSSAMNLDNKPYANRGGWLAVQGVVDRGVKGRVRPGPWIVSFRLDHEMEAPPDVSLIAYAGTRPRLLPDGIQSAVQMGHYQSLEILASVDPEELGDQRLPRYVDPPVRQVDPVDGLGPYASLNRAALEASGECLVFMDGCFRPRDSEWLAELVSQAMRPGVGAVGGRVLYPDGTVQHAGYVLGLRGELGLAGSAYRGLPGHEGGYVGRAQLRQDMSAVGIGCFAIRRSLFERLGGFDAERFPVALGALDLCMRLRELGERIIWTPFATGAMQQFVNATAERDAAHPGLTPSLRELAEFRSRWGNEIARDPSYNPNLSLATTDCHLAFPPRLASLNELASELLPGAHAKAIAQANAAEQESPPADGHGVRAIAFYLPQFHPIPENDRWWGRGFTEWRSVTKARPLFQGHEQPHLPGELGFYDLRLPEARERQVELARDAGISAFCYYHYWFAGKRLLEQPFEAVLASGKPDFPFCLAWANENWTRRWDGSESEILIAQEYGPETGRRLIRDLFAAFEDRRYLRVDGKPLFLVYRPSLIPEIDRITDLWREEARAAGIGELHLCSVHSCWNFDDPRSNGFDAAVEFPPHLPKLRPVDPAWIRDPVPGFNAWVYDYRSVLFDCIERPRPAYPLYRGVMPSWDNSARRQSEAVIIQNSRPGDYAFWLEEAARITCEWHEGDERLLFINAWNEWGEGCHLEPSEATGRAFLDATRDALERFGKSAGGTLPLNRVR